MKINPLGEPHPKEVGDRVTRGTGGIGAVPVQAGSAGSGPATPVSAVSESDRIELSDMSRALTENPGEPFDAAKVAEIRKAISEGRFSVNAERVADRMINDAAELIVRIFAPDSRPQQ